MLTNSGPRKGAVVVKEEETTAFSLPESPCVFRISFDHLHTLLSWSLEQARKFFEHYVYDNTSKENLDERK